MIYERYSLASGWHNFALACFQVRSTAQMLRRGPSRQERRLKLSSGPLLLLLLLLLLLYPFYLSPHQVSCLPQHVYHLTLRRGIELHVALYPPYAI